MASPLRVLVVDDSEVILLATAEGLSAEGFEVETATNPILVASQLRKFSPHVLLLDVDMPALKGPDVVAALRKTDALGSTSVVLYSATENEENLRRLARECGAAEALPKSIRGPALARRLQALRRSKLDESGRFRRLSLKSIVIAPVDVESELVGHLNGLGVETEVRGPFGVDRALREGGVQLAVLHEGAFSRPLGEVVSRLHQRGLLEGVALLALSRQPVKGADAHMDSNAISRAALTRRVNQAVAESRTRRSS